MSTDRLTSDQLRAKMRIAQANAGRGHVVGILTADEIDDLIGELLVFRHEHPDPRDAPTQESQPQDPLEGRGQG